MADTKVKKRIRDFLRTEFVRAEDDRVIVRDGYADNVHVAIVSHRFDRLNPRERHGLIWDLLWKNLPKEVWGTITLAQDYTPREFVSMNGGPATRT